MCLKLCICCLIFIPVLIFVILVGAICIVPLVFKFSSDVQIGIIFPTGLVTNTEFNPELFLLKGAKNFRVLVDEKDNITLGVWHILPQQLINEFTKSADYDYDKLLKNEDDVIIFLHGNAMDRTQGVPLYLTLRQFFHVFAVDYRSYGDSSKGPMSETSVVNDIFNFHGWLRNRTNGSIYVWGHSLGSGVGTHLVSNLKDNNITTGGLVLEAPFSSVPDAVELHPLSLLFSWIPWYEFTMVQPFKDNDVAFETKNYIKNVDCPIMLLHAENDDIISFKLSDKLYNIATNKRNLEKQGNVTYHLLSEPIYGHMNIYDYPYLHIYIEQFLNTTIEYKHHVNDKSHSMEP